MENNIKSKIEVLRGEIIKHDISYANGNPTITDTEYDRMYMELISLETKYPDFYDKNSPTQRIYTIVVDGLDEIKHKQPMLSQKKTTTMPEVYDFIKKGAGDDILIQQKLDGLTIVLKYQDGLLKQAITRGNGYVGTDITHVILNTSNVPKLIDFKGKLEIRAEGIIPEDAFEKINVFGKYKSARNLAAGTVRSLKGSVAKERGLKLIVFDLVSADGMDFSTDIEQLQFMDGLGFEVVEYKLFNSDSIEIEEYITSYNEKRRPLLPHKIDGLVLKFNKLIIREELGYTSKFPRWGIAYKFESLDVITKLLDVEWTVGKNGQITPNAILDPCEIDGVSIKKASLANYEDIVRRDIKIGDDVLVIRANDVIPKVVGPIEENRTGMEQKIMQINTCPVCGSPLEKELSIDGSLGVHLYCINANCPAQLLGKIQHYASRDALNIDGLGDKTIKQLMDNNLIKSFIDIYKLKNLRSELSKIERFGEKTIDNLLKGIESSKDVSFANLINALSIRFVGEGTGKRIANHYGSMENLLSKVDNEELFYKDLSSIEDIGEATATSLCKFFTNLENIELMNQLRSNGLSMVQEKKEVVESFFSGRTVVITGTLSNYNRKEIGVKLESLGAKVSGSVSKKTNYVIYGVEAGSKYDKAITLGVPVLSESEFENLIK